MTQKRTKKLVKEVIRKFELYCEDNNIKISKDRFFNIYSYYFKRKILQKPIEILGLGEGEKSLKRAIKDFENANPY